MIIIHTRRLDRQTPPSAHSSRAPSPTAASSHPPHPCRNAPLPRHAPAPTPTSVTRATCSATSLSLLLLRRGDVLRCEHSTRPPLVTPSSSLGGHPSLNSGAGMGMTPAATRARAQIQRGRVALLRHSEPPIPADPVAMALPVAGSLSPPILLCFFQSFQTLVLKIRYS